VRSTARFGRPWDRVRKTGSLRTSARRARWRSGSNVREHDVECLGLRGTQRRAPVHTLGDVEASRPERVPHGNPDEAVVLCQQQLHGGAVYPAVTEMDGPA
jgi:hypothetical protein